MALDLKGKQVEALCAALLSAYPGWSDLDMMVEFELGESLEGIVARSDMKTVTLALVRWAHKKSRLDDLLAAALQQNPSNQDLRRFAYEVSLSSDAAPVAKLEARIMPSVPFAHAADWRARMARAERCICRVEVQRGGAWDGVGTGFLVGPEVILTNHHVADAVRATGGSGRAQLDYALDASCAERTGRAVAFAADWSLAESPVAALDFALVRLAEAVGDEILDGGPATRAWLSPAKHAFTVGEPFFILQHPDADRLKIGVGAVSELQARPPRVRYTTNTLPGSSGSPCFTMGWELVALHHASEASSNRGIPLGPIVDALAAAGKGGFLGART
jgi:hypothetical protein